MVNHGLSVVWCRGGADLQGQRSTDGHQYSFPLMVQGHKEWDLIDLQHRGQTGHWSLIMVSELVKWLQSQKYK